jgi:chemotaxis protein MotB
MNTHRIAVATLVAIASLTLGGCGSERELAYKDTQIQELERVNKELENQLQACANEKVSHYVTQHPDEPAHVVARNTIDNATVSQRPMETVISIENNILFKPGLAELSTAAKSTLSHVIAVINEKYKNCDVRVEGFTDNQKINRTKDKWDDNWDLSGGRGQAVLHYLLDHGIPAAKLGFAGYGEERPLVPNTSEANKAKNRRVEIVVIPRDK